VNLKSVRQPKRHDVWVSEFRVRDVKVTPALRKLIALVRRYEDLSGTD
jgi:hypothetical protein